MLLEYDPEANDAVPAGQRVQETAPLLLDQDPAGQIKQLSEPEPLYEPGAHIWHADLELEPVKLLAVPAGHGAQSASEVRSGKELKVPAGQGTQDEAPRAALAYVPAAQTVHCDVAKEALPAVHDEHVDWPPSKISTAALLELLPVPAQRH